MVKEIADGKSDPKNNDSAELVEAANHSILVTLTVVCGRELSIFGIWRSAFGEVDGEKIWDQGKFIYPETPRYAWPT